MKPYFLSVLLPMLFLSFPDERLEPSSHYCSPPGEIKYHLKAKEMPDLSIGPFERMKNGEIVTVNETECLISSDEGKTWTKHPLFNYKNAYKVRPERALICTKEGTLILAFANDMERMNWEWDPMIHDSPKAKLPTYVVRSLDGGRTWEAPNKLHDDWTGAIRDIIQTKAGSVVFTTMKMQHDPGHHAIITYTSMDEGKTWTGSNLIDLGGIGHHSGVIESTIEQLQDGRIWMLMRTVWGRFWEAFSNDEGATWKDYNVTEILASTAPGLVKRLTSGRLVLVYNQLYPEGETTYPLVGGKGQWSEVPAINHRKELSIRFSEDEGENWSAPIVLGKTDKDISYPYLFEVRPGELWVTTWRGEFKARILERDFL